MHSDAPYPSSMLTRRRVAMADVAYVVLTVVLFALLAWAVRAVEKL